MSQGFATQNSIPNPLTVARGGTGLTTTTANNLLYSSATGVIANLPTAASMQIEAGTLATKGGLVLISSAQATASSAIDFTSINNTVYNSYCIVGDNIIPTTDATSLLMYISIAGTFIGAAGNYRHQNWRYTSSANGVSGSTADTQIIINSSSETLGSSADEVFSFKLLFFNAGQTTQKKRCNWEWSMISSAPTTLSGVAGGMFIGSNGAVDGFRFGMSSGTIASGIFTLYGIKNT